jgi:hypothetical protein
MKGMAVLGGCGVALLGLLTGQERQLTVAPAATSSEGLGRRIALESQTIDGQRFSLDSDAKATVIALTDVSCPLTKKYAPTLAALEEKYKAQGVRFVFLNPNKSEERAAIQSEIAHHGFDGPYIWDIKGTLTATLGAKTTTEVFLLDSKNTLVYRGAVDDQYGLGYQNDAPRNTYLVHALESVLKAERPKVECTSAPGCDLILDVKPMDRAVTYHDQVARILQRNCVSCHRDGGVAPFALDSYKKAEAFKGMIKTVVENGTMPPWFAAPMSDGHSPWANDRSLSAQDKKELTDWIANGCPEGDAKLTPAPLKFHETWTIGEPDHVFQIPRKIDVKATGQMPYYHLRVDTNFDEDKWLDAMEVQPTDRSVVHHVLIFIAENGKIGGRGLLDVDESTGFLMGYVPGTDHVVYPEGEAKRIPKGATLLFQIHYTPNGKATSDQTRLAVRFAKKPPTKEVQVYGIVNRTFAIPPGAPAHSDTRTVTAPRDIYVTSLMPHMHVRGKAFKFEATYPDGKKEVLLDVPRYDFNWQITYRYREPKFMPKGTKITATGTFDNSDKNPANPDPTKTVHWGLQTTEEMLLGYVEFYAPGSKPGEIVTLGGG